MDNISLFHCRLRLFKVYYTVKVSMATKITGHFSNITYYLCLILFDSESSLCQQRKEHAGSLPILLSVRFHPLDRLRI